MVKEVQEEDKLQAYLVSDSQYRKSNEQSGLSRRIMLEVLSEKQTEQEESSQSLIGTGQSCNATQSDGSHKSLEKVEDREIYLTPMPPSRHSRASKNSIKNRSTLAR